MTQSRTSAALWFCVLIVGVGGAIAVGWFIGPHLSGTSAFPKAIAGAAAVTVLATAVWFLEPAWILSAGLALSVFSGDWRYMHIPGPIDRVVIFVGLAAAVVRTLGDPTRPRITVRPVHWLMALLIAFAVGSAAWVGTLTDHTSQFALLDRLGLVPFLLYLAAPVIFPDDRQRTILLWTLVVVGAYLGLTALFEFVGPKVFVVPSYINNPALGIHGGRARGPFLEAGADGLAMFASGVAATMLLARATNGRRRALLLAVVVLCALGIVLSLTRQVWAGCAVGALVASVWSPSLRRYIPAAVVLVAVIFGAAIVAVPGLQNKLDTRATTQKSIWDRLNSDAAALRMFETKPLAGFGWGTFPTRSAGYYHVADSYPLSAVAEVHNVVLSNAAELGAIGLALWFTTMFLAFVTPFFQRGPPETERWKVALLALVVAWFVQANFAPLSYAFDNYVPWIFASIALGDVRTAPRAPANQSQLVRAQRPVAEPS